MSFSDYSDSESSIIKVDRKTPAINLNHLKKLRTNIRKWINNPKNADLLIKDEKGSLVSDHVYKYKPGKTTWFKIIGWDVNGHCWQLLTSYEDPSLIPVKKPRAKLQNSVRPLHMSSKK